MKWIDDILLGITDYYQTKNVLDLYNGLGIEIVYLDENNVLLQGNEAVYHRFNDFEIVYISNNTYNRDFVLAHELGHALLHTHKDLVFYNPYENFGMEERQANYFATKLLYGDLEINECFQTKKELADYLGIKVEFIDFLLDT